MTTKPKEKLLIFIVCYNAERFIDSVIKRIPVTSLEELHLDTEILIIDDKSPDSTFEKAKQITNNHIKITALQNPKNLGYGGNQKIGYQYALRHNFDYVVLLHGDGQYAPEMLPQIISQLTTGKYGAVYGSRMINSKEALKGGMPFYKYYANKFLTLMLNKVVGTNLTEYHSGYRSYSLKALRTIPFQYNSDGFDFDTDIIIQLHRWGYLIKEVPIPTFYGKEKCHVNGIKYAFNILRTALISRIQTLGLLYDQRFDVEANCFRYKQKLDFLSPHSDLLSLISEQDNILYFGPQIEDLINGIKSKSKSFANLTTDINNSEASLSISPDDANINSLAPYNKFIALDTIQRLNSPEVFLQKLKTVAVTRNCEFFFIVPNIGFIITRLMLLFGYFHYGKHGILDREHHRLFTKKSFAKLLAQEGYSVKKFKGYPAPFPLALPTGPKTAKFFLVTNSLLIKLLPGVFSFQLFYCATKNPTLDSLLDLTISYSAEKKAP